MFAYWAGHYFVFGSAFALTLGLILLVPLVLIAMARIEEIAAIAFGRGPRRLIAKSAPVAPATIGDGVAFPKVSIHIPAYFEPVEMLKQTLDAVSRLDYPNFECVCIINNTPGSGILAADPGSLPHARRALQVHQRREGPGLQGRRAAHRHGPHRRRRRDHRHHRRRLCRAAGLAEGSGACVRRSRASAWCRRRRSTATATAR